MTTWTVQLRGLRNLPRRLVFIIASVSRLFWWATVVVVPTILLVPGVVDSRLSVLYYAFTAGICATFFQTQSGLLDTTVTLDGNDNQLKSTYTFGTIYRREINISVSFDTIERVNLIRVQNFHLLRFRYERWFTNTQTTFLVPQSHIEDVREILRQQSIPVTEHDTATWRTWGRSVVSLVSLGIVPLSLVPLWGETSFYLIAVLGIGFLRVAILSLKRVGTVLLGAVR